MKMTPQTLSALFIVGLRSTVTPEEYSAILKKNATPDYDGCCASHDYCDANMVMLEAYAHAMKRDPERVNLDKVWRLFNEAWTIARRDYLTGK
jgi:hypothetical protein